MQPGSLDAEAGIFCSSFDQTGTRLITGCADKSTYVPSNSSDQNLSRNVDRSGNCMVLNELDSRGRQIWSKHRWNYGAMALGLDGAAEALLVHDVVALGLDEAAEALLVHDAAAEADANRHEAPRAC